MSSEQQLVGPLPFCPHSAPGPCSELDQDHNHSQNKDQGPGPELGKIPGPKSVLEPESGKVLELEPKLALEPNQNQNQNQDLNRYLNQS